MIEGIVVQHSTSWNVKLMSLINVHVQNIKVLGWRCWNDGIDVVSSQGVLIDDVFIRSDDDAIAIKGMDPDMDTENIVVRSCILWNQKYGNCMEIGFELFNARVRNISFESNVCIHQSGAIASVHDGGRATVSGIRYSDTIAQTLWVPKPNRNPDHGLKLLDYQIVYGQYCTPEKGCRDPNARGVVTDISIEGLKIYSNGVVYRFSRFEGNSSSHEVSGVVITDLTVDGKKATALKDINATENRFAEGITFA